MANPNRAFGLRVPLTQGLVTVHTVQLEIPAINDKPIGNGTPLVINRSTGFVEVAESGVDAASVDFVTQTMTDLDGKPLFILPAETAGIVTAVSTKDHNLFEVQADNQSPIVDANRLSRYNLTVVAPDPLTGVDQSVIDSSTATSDDLPTGQRMFEMIGFAFRIPKIIAGDNPIILVRAFNFTQ